MFFFWLSVFLPATMVLGLGRVNTNDLHAVNFAAEIIGHKLIGRVIAETEEDSEDACQLKCVAKSRCLSYNFGSAEDGKRFKCQLSDSDRFAAADNFTQEDKFSYRGIQVLRNWAQRRKRQVRKLIIITLFVKLLLWFNVHLTNLLVCHPAFIKRHKHIDDKLSRDKKFHGRSLWNSNNLIYRAAWIIVKADTFPRKLWFCVGGLLQDDLVSLTELIMWSGYTESLLSWPNHISWKSPSYAKSDRYPLAREIFPMQAECNSCKQLALH